LGGKCGSNYKEYHYLMSDHLKLNPSNIIKDLIKYLVNITFIN